MDSILCSCMKLYFLDVPDNFFETCNIYAGDLDHDAAVAACSLWGQVRDCYLHDGLPSAGTLKYY